MDKIITYTITASEDGWPLYKVLRERLALSGSRIRHLKYIPGGITVNGASYLRSRPVTTRFILKAGDELRLLLTDEGPSVVPNPGPLTLLYQSDDLLFVDKPAGLAVHPAHGHYTDTLVNRLSALYPEPIRLIGRLDKDTSGVLAVARNAIAATRMENQRKDKTLQRIYLALVLGEPEKDLSSENPAAFSGDSLPSFSQKGIIELPLLETRENTPLGMNGHPLRLMKTDPAGLEAVTEYEVLKTYSGYSLIRLKLLTGRTHQIRAHMAFLGHPLLGDRLYQEFSGYEGPFPPVPAPRTLLHSWQIHCRHPFTEEPLTIEAPLPEDFSVLINSKNYK